jgi:hypothetical protein
LAVIVRALSAPSVQNRSSMAQSVSSSVMVQSFILKSSVLCVVPLSVRISERRY